MFVVACFLFLLNIDLVWFGSFFVLYCVCRLCLVVVFCVGVSILYKLGGRLNQTHIIFFPPAFPLSNP